MDQVHLALEPDRAFAMVPVFSNGPGGIPARLREAHHGVSYRVRRMKRWILPLGVFGSSLTNTTSRG